MLQVGARRLVGALVQRGTRRICHVASFSRVQRSHTDAPLLRRHSAVAAAAALPIEQPQEEPDASDIEAFDIGESLKLQLRRAGVSHLFPVQRQCFDLVMSGRDMMCKSRTGSGKTLAFAIPICESLHRRREAHVKPGVGRAPQALVLAPTRELAKQVEKEFLRIDPRMSTLSMYGGTPQGPQLGALRRGVDVVVGTPGRVIDHLKQGSLRLGEIQFMVLDEADMMLQMGFQEDVETILSYLPAQRQTMLWSATMPRWVLTLSKRYLKQPEFIDLVGEDSAKIPSAIEHLVTPATNETRPQVLSLIARNQGAGKRMIVFTQTKSEVDAVAAQPSLAGVRVAPLHGGLSQQQREATLEAFRDGKVQMLVATDVAARGLDIPSVDMVVHYRLPRDPEAFVHRAGRTGRAGRSGVNLALVGSGAEEADYAALQREFGFEASRVGWPPAVAAAAAASVSGQIMRDMWKVSSTQLKAFMPAARDVLDNMAKHMGAEQHKGASSFDAANASSILASDSSVATAPANGNAVAVRAVSAAMALLAAAKNGVGAVDSLSLIDGGRGRQTVYLRGPQVRDASDVRALLSYVDPSYVQAMGPLRRAAGGIVFDLAPDAAAQFVTRISEITSDAAGAEGPSDGNKRPPQLVGLNAELPSMVPNTLEYIRDASGSGSVGGNRTTHRYGGSSPMGGRFSSDRSSSGFGHGRGSRQGGSARGGDTSSGRFERGTWGSKPSGGGGGSRSGGGNAPFRSGGSTSGSVPWRSGGGRSVPW